MDDIPETPRNRFIVSIALIATAILINARGLWLAQARSAAMKSISYRKVVLWTLWILGALFLICVIAAFFVPAIGASKAKRSISEAMQSPRTVTSLALWDKELNKFPDEIRQFPELDNLILYGDKPTEVPDWIVQNQKLENLWMHDFKLEPFPEALTQLTHLEDLRLRNCMITKLPPTIGKLKSLEFLILNNNKLTDLPDEISELTSLKELDLKGNPLTPAVLERIRKLLPNTDVEFEKQ